MPGPQTDNAEPVTLDLQPGFFSEASPRGAKGRWKTGDRVRFKNGRPMKLGGWVQPLITGAAFKGLDRREWEWASLDSQAWLAQGTSKKLYITSRGVRYDITPIRDTASLTNPFTTTSGSATVVVADADHGAQLGDFVHFSGASAVGGLTIDGEYEITGITDNSSYSVTAGSAASSSATGGGSVVAQYEISIGLGSASQAVGWGTCTWGTGTWGTRRGSCSDVTLPLRIWSLDNFGEDLIASPRGGAIYWWDRTSGPTSRAVLLDNAPRTNEHVLVSNSGDQIIALGAFDELANSPNKMLVRTSQVGTLNVWEIDDNNPETLTVFEEVLSTGSRIIMGLRTRNGIFIGTDKAEYLMQPDAQQVFRIGKIGEENTIVGPNAGIDVGGTIFGMASSKFVKFDGVYSELPCPVWGFLFDTNDPATPGISADQIDKVYTFHNETFSEIWWLYPASTPPLRITTDGSFRTTTGGDFRAIAGEFSENSRYVIFNYGDNCWYYGTIDRTAMSPRTLTYGVPFGASSAGQMFTHETGTDDDAVAMNEFIESYDIQLGEGKAAMHVRQFIPDYMRIIGTLRLTLSAKSRPQDAVYKVFGPYSFTGANALVGVRAAGRQMSVRIDSTTAGTDWRDGAGSFELQADGER